ncbi:twin-arginine translocase TatA/TatE family subunit [Kitasatospora sp. LaBMicrA B282]|uniref:twin-arginine translocase TatA/TatE family subunit n=1 Tax=Kitasatospora sp. LaBMicrA B282 TaxID=3420949 RepID=UPI003D102AA4
MGRILAFLIIIVMAAVFFGGKKLPDLARAVGRSMRILKSETAALREEYAKEARGEVDQPVADPGPTIKAAPGDTAGTRPAGEPPADRAR